jgi:hypothetical protein
MASLNPLIRVIRSGSPLFSAVAESVTLNNALNESKESDASVMGGRGVEILYTDLVEIVVGGDVYGPFTVSTIQREASGESTLTSLTLASCGEAYRNAATPDDDPFSASSNLNAFLKLPGFVAKKTGVDIPLTFVSAESLVMGANFSVGSTNALDLMRSLCGATANAFRFTDDCQIEVGRFGASSGLFIRNRTARSQNGQSAAEFGAVVVDASDTYSYVYAEGGTFKKSDGEDYNLSMGSRSITTFDLTPPDGYSITTDEVGKKLFYQLSRDAATVKRGKRVQIGGITPLNDTLASEKAAAKLLMNIAAKYLESKAEPEVTVSATLKGYVKALPGDTAKLFISSGDKTILDGDYYILSASYSMVSGRAETAFEFSSRLTDPEQLLQATSPKAGDTGSKPHQSSGASGVTLTASVFLTDPVCGDLGNGRSVYVSYAVHGFLATPTLSFECPAGVTAEVTSSDTSGATICVKKTFWTSGATITVIAVGVLPV